MGLIGTTVEMKSTSVQQQNKDMTNNNGGSLLVHRRNKHGKKELFAATTTWNANYCINWIVYNIERGYPVMKDGLLGYN